MSPDLAARLEALEAERLRPSRDETPSNPLRELIALLHQALTDPPLPVPEDEPKALPEPDFEELA